MFATNISTVHLVSLAQMVLIPAYSMATLNGWLPSHLSFWLYFFRHFTLGQVWRHCRFFRKRYDRQSRDWLVIISVVSP